MEPSQSNDSKPAFKSALVAEKLDNGLWRLREPLIYWSNILQAHITAENGFITDFASIPWFGQWLISKDGPWDWGAVIHDKLYKSQVTSRLLSDQILLEAMIAKNVDRFRRDTIYRAVRVGGFKAWNKHRKENKGILPQERWEIKK